jgi:SPOR domain
MARAALRQIVLGLATTGLLMGCVEGGGTGGAADGSGIAAAPAKKKAGSADVEAPEVFEATDSALWDGRPSLGGIWVASPEVTSPERVLMFNPATGKSVTGALFRRERDNPGPRLQLSSDAAEALGILAGQPTEIRVTALRKEEVEEPAPVEDTAPVDEATAVAALESEAEIDPDATTVEAGEAAAIASAALDAVDAGDATAPALAAGEGADGIVDPAAAAAAGAALAVDEKPKRKTWKERRAEAKAAREAKKKAATEAAAAGGEVVDGAAQEPAAEAAGVATIETAPLDARSTEVTEAADSATVAGPAKVKEPEPAEAAAAEATPEVAASTGSRPIQVASFSKEDNAKRAADALAKIGITATPQKSERNGKAVWGVVVTGDDAMLAKIKDAGFADAYYLK